VLAIASQIESQGIGMAFFQETHPERTFQECSYWCETVTPKQMPHALRVAIQTAVAQRGVSAVCRERAVHPAGDPGEQIRGSATSASKAGLGGGVGKMIDLARSNLRNVPRP
jgi:hypothetical protein